MTREFTTRPYDLCHRMGPDNFVARVFGVPTYFVLDRMHAEKVLNCPTLSGKVGNRSVASDLFGTSLLYDDGPSHQDLRSALAPLFQRPSAAALAEIQKAALRLASALPQEGLAFGQFFRSLSVAATGSHYLGLEVGAEEALWLSRHIDDLGSGLYASQPGGSRNSRFGRAMVAREKLLEFLRGAISKGQLERLNALGMSPATTLDQALTFLFAGVDTISATMAWAALTVSTADDRSDPMVASAYANALLQRPPVYFIPRGATEETDLGTVVIPEGWNVNVMVSELHERHRVGSPDGCALPYGRGSKMCPARSFANLAGPAILSALFSEAGLLLNGSSRGVSRRFIPGQRPVSPGKWTIEC